MDRGPKSKEVVERVIQLKEEGAIVLRGNHDEMMVEVAEKNRSCLEKVGKK